MEGIRLDTLDNEVLESLEYYLNQTKKWKFSELNMNHLDMVRIKHEALEYEVNQP